MFNGSVTGLTLCSFALMVGSSVIAAWADISSAWTATVDPTTGREIIKSGQHMIGSINVGYVWMAMNCFASAAYVRLSGFPLTHSTVMLTCSLAYATGAVHEETNQDYRIQRLGFHVLQQPLVHSYPGHRIGFDRRLGI